MKLDSSLLPFDSEPDRAFDPNVCSNFSSLGIFPAHWRCCIQARVEYAEFGCKQRSNSGVLSGQTLGVDSSSLLLVDDTWWTVYWVSK